MRNIILYLLYGFMYRTKLGTTLGTTTSLDLDNIHTTILLIRPILLSKRI
jgi:hypothetical protein